MKTNFTEVLIVGSGFGGAVPALRFATAGFSTIVIEKGPKIDPYRDFKQTQDPKYLLKYLKNLKGKNISLNYVEGQGGGSGFYEMVSLRAPSLIFEQKDEDGQRLWPKDISRKSLDPHYTTGEEMLNVHQIAAKDVPKTGLVFSSLMRNLGYSVDRARYAVKDCMDSGRCVTGCIYGAKQSLLLNYIPMAIKAGARFDSDLDAISITPLRGFNSPGNTIFHENKRHYNYEVLCRNTESGEQILYRTKILFLAGGTVGTAKLLLASKEFLPQLSKETGKNIAFNGSVKIAGIIPEEYPDADLFTGRSHPGMVSYQFVDSNKIMISSGKPLPLQLFGVARITSKGGKGKKEYWGKNHVELMKKLRKRIIFLIAQGMTPPSAKISLRKNGKLKLSLEITESLKNYYESTKNLLGSIITRNGGKLLNIDFLDGKGSPVKGTNFTSSHQVGSCRMSDSKMNGVVDSMGEIFDYPGIFITDGSAIPSSLIVNSSLTILANAERITEKVLDRYLKFKAA